MVGTDAAAAVAAARAKAAALAAAVGAPQAAPAEVDVEVEVWREEGGGTRRRCFLMYLETHLGEAWAVNACPCLFLVGSCRLFLGCLCPFFHDICHYLVESVLIFRRLFISSIILLLERRVLLSRFSWAALVDKKYCNQHNQYDYAQ